MATPSHQHVTNHEHVTAEVPVVEEHVDRVVTPTAAEVRVSRFAWSPAQVIAAGFGLLLVVMGAVALLRVGLDSLTGDTAVVWMFQHTALMGIIDIVAGLMFLAAAGSALGSRNGLITLGMLALAFGLIIAIEPAAMSEVIGGDERIGWLYAIIGAVSVLVAFASRTVNVRRASTSEVVHP